VRALQVRVLRLQAEGAAEKISNFIKGIESQVGWTTQLPWSAGTRDQRRFDGMRLLRQVPAITELVQLDATGKDHLSLSRQQSCPISGACNVGGNDGDYSKDPKFTEAVAHRVYYGPVYVRRQTAPYMTLSLAGTRRDAGVSVAEVSLTLVWDLVRELKVGERGVGYVLDGQGRVIAHSDFDTHAPDAKERVESLFQRDFSSLAYVQAARAAGAGAGTGAVPIGRDLNGHDVLVAYTTIPPLDWLIFVEVPVEDADAIAR